jgi:hypothetical protein
MPPHEDQAIKRQLFADWSAGKRLSIKDILAHRNLPPDEKDREAYLDLRMQQAMAETAVEISLRITAADLVETIDTAHLSSPSVYTTITKRIGYTSDLWLPFGCDKQRTVLYRLLVNPWELQPHQTAPPTTTASQVLPDWFLGLNSTIQPRYPALPLSHRKAGLSEQSTASADSDDAEQSPGFEFFQLGRLEWVEDSPWDRAQAGFYGPDGPDWLDTAFVVVARLSNTGHCDGIYIVADMFPEDETGKREAIVGPEWGKLPGAGPEQQFSCARVGRCLGDLVSFDTELKWTDVIEHPVELVRLKVTGSGRVLRSSIDGASIATVV